MNHTSSPGVYVHLCASMTALNKVGLQVICMYLTQSLVITHAHPYLWLFLFLIVTLSI